ncbi:ferritin-like domain-containing protein [Hyalangium versicolor]|uniref:ferritin-like domain-containing protein n=1 Tax=Hyalangium versicolor TaxID=2861190 RepID=UPI001CCD9E24|nr:ferritin-like domain-containing protein [Hyalangium versicolor]
MSVPSQPSPTPDSTPPTRHSFLASFALVLTTLPLASWGLCVSGTLDPDSRAAGSIWIGACVFSLLGALLGLINAIRLRPRNGERIEGRGMSWWALALGLLSPVVSFFLGIATVNFHMAHGRALRRGGRAQLPPPGSDMGWVEDLRTRLDVPPGVAAAWRAQAGMEAASVAAFAHLSNELLALGAPAHLIEKAHWDALDEIRHARLCYGLATAMDGQAQGPAPFPAAVLTRDRRLDVASLAAECMVESCLLEAASARVAGVLSSRSEGPAEIRAVLDIIAVDEARHAAHGWEIISWCREVAGTAIDAELRRALSRVDVASAQAAVEHDELAAWGIAGPTLWRQCIAETLADALARLGEAPEHSLAA